MHEHFYFHGQTKFWDNRRVQTYWTCIHKCTETCNKIYNQKMNYLTDNYLHADKKRSSNMVLTFAMAHINICVKWLLIVSYLQYTQVKKHVAVDSKNTAVNIGSWKLHGWRACRQRIIFTTFDYNYIYLQTQFKK